MLFNTLQEKINQNPKIDFGDIFSKSIELFKKSWTHGLVLQLITMVIVLPIIIVLYVPIIMAAIGAENGNVRPETFNEIFAGFSVLYIVLFIVAILAISVIVQALKSGFFRVLKRIDHDEVVKTSDLFYFLKGEYLIKLITIMFATLGISIVAMLLFVLPLYYAMIPMSFFVLFFTFNPELSVRDIIKLSFSIGTKKWLITFGLTIVASFLASFVGFLMCGIGMLVTATFVYHPIYFIYKEVIGFNQNGPINSIGKE